MFQYNEQNVGNFTSSYEPDFGYTFRFGIEDVKIDWLIMRFTLGFDNYGGKVEASGGGRGYNISTKAEVEKSIVSLGFFPINIKLFEVVNLNIGFEISRLISEKYSGTYVDWTRGRTHTCELSDKFERYSAKAYFGFIGRIAYDIDIAENVVISPQYSIYVGTTHEFDVFPAETQSVRQFLSVGFQRKLKTNEVKSD